MSTRPQVTYCVSGFVDRNNDTLSEEIRGLVQTSSNQLLKGLFSGDDLGAGGAGGKEAALEAGKSPSKLQSFLKQASVTQKFKTQLADLMGVIEGTTVQVRAGALWRAWRCSAEPHPGPPTPSPLARSPPQYVRCIKPNARKSPETFDRKMVVEQVPLARLEELAQALQALTSRHTNPLPRDGRRAGAPFGPPG